MDLLGRSGIAADWQWRSNGSLESALIPIIAGIWYASWATACRNRWNGPPNAMKKRSSIGKCITGPSLKKSRAGKADANVRR